MQRNSSAGPEEHVIIIRTERSVHTSQSSMPSHEHEEQVILGSCELSLGASLYEEGL